MVLPSAAVTVPGIGPNRPLLLLAGRHFPPDELVAWLEGSVGPPLSLPAVTLKAKVPLPMCVPCTDPAGVLVQPDMKLPTQVPVSCPNPMTRQARTHGSATTAVPTGAMEAPMKSRVTILLRGAVSPLGALV